MEEIDRLGWAAGISFMSYGLKVGVRVNDPAILERLPDHLPPGWKPATSPIVERLYSLRVGGSGPRPSLRRFNLLYGDITRVARSEHVDQVLDAFESDVQRHVAEAAKRRVFVHAGVVGWRGQAIVIPGRTFTGKTTLVAELLRAGAAYYSDEYAVLDSRGRVHPYARPLGIREDGTGNQKKYSAGEIGGRPGGKPLPVGLVVVSEYRAGARWRPRRLSAGQGVLALLENTLSVRRQPEPVLATLQAAVARALVVKGPRGEARDVVDSIVSRFGENGRSAYRPVT